MEKDEISLRRKFSSVWSLLDERSRRLLAASELLLWGMEVSRGFGEPVGFREKPSPRDARNRGGKCAAGTDSPGGRGPEEHSRARSQASGLLDRLIEPETRGDPESPLRWICKSTRVWLLN